MKYFPIPQLAGVKKDVPVRALPENKCSDVLNVLFEEGTVKTRWGYRQLPISNLFGGITHIVEYDKLETGEKFLVVCTTRLVYFFNTVSGFYEILNTSSAFPVALVTADAELTIDVTGSLSTLISSEAECYAVFYYTAFDVYSIPIQINFIDQNTFKIYDDHVLFLASDLKGFYGVTAPSQFEYFFIIDDEPYTEVLNLKLFDISDVSFLGEFMSPYIIGNNINNLLNEISRTSVTVDFAVSDNGLIEVSGVDISRFSQYGYLLYRDLPTSPPVSEYEGYLMGHYSIIDGVMYCGFWVELYGVLTATWIFGRDTSIPLTVVSMNLTSLQNDVFQWSNLSSVNSVSIYQGDVGDYDNIYDSAIAFDQSDEENILLLTNGISAIKKWAGSGTLGDLGERTFTATRTSGSPILTAVNPVLPIKELMVVTGTGIAADSSVVSVDVTNSTVTLNNNASATGTSVLIGRRLPNKAKYIDFFGSIGYEHIIIADTNDGTSYNRQTIEMSNSAEVDVWNEIWFDLLDTNDTIVGIKKLGTRLIVYKQQSITEAWPIVGGGTENSFDFNQNKINIGTPSIRTVVDFDSYHIFMGWDNVYAFNGISVQAIGFDIINDLTSGANKPFLDRSFAFHVKNKNLYCLFVPWGGEEELCNRGYIYNYSEQTWTIWQLPVNVTCHGYYHDERAVLWEYFEDPILTENVSLTSEDYGITVSDASLLAVGNVIEGDGILFNTFITKIDGNDITMSAPASDTATNSLSFYTSYMNMSLRWVDYLVYEDNERLLLGDDTGMLYEISENLYDDNGTDIVSYFVTRDYPLNDPKHWFKLLQGVIGSQNLQEQSYTVEASVDFGNTWTDPIQFDVDVGVDYIEHIANWLNRGRQVRFRIANVDGSYFKIENMIVGYVDSGITNLQGV